MKSLSRDEIIRSLNVEFYFVDKKNTYSRIISTLIYNNLKMIEKLKK